MSTDSAIDLVRQAIWLGLLIGAPVLLVSIAISFFIGVLQAATQIQEQTLAFVPRLVIGILTTLLLLPWGLQRLAEFATQVFLEIPPGSPGR